MSNYPSNALGANSTYTAQEAETAEPFGLGFMRTLTPAEMAFGATNPLKSDVNGGGHVDRDR